MRSKLHSLTVSLDHTVRLIDHLPTSDSVAFVKDGQGLVGGGIAVEIPVPVTANREHLASELLHEIFDTARIEDPVDFPGSGPIAMGSFSFDREAEGSRLVIPRWTLGHTDQGTWLTINATEPIEKLETTLPPVDATRTIPRATLEDRSGPSWEDDVLKARDLIRSGHLEKVVLARSIDVETSEDIHVPSIARHLASRFPGCYTFVFSDLVGASPELLVRKLGEWVDAIPLAGSAPRHPDSRQDELLGNTLQRSRKDRWEHELAVRTVVDVLRPLCGQLQVEEEPFLYLLPNVQHLGTKIQGRLSAEADCLHLVGELHPTAAVCGLPRDRAMDVIRSLERFERGRYSGPVGWMDRNGDGEWAIALRCAQIMKRSAVVYAGAGIVADSDPEAELEETRLKLSAILDVFGL